MHCTNINMDSYSNEKDIEYHHHTVYRSPTGNIEYFLNNLEATLNQVYHHQSVMELGHLLTRSGLMYPEVSLTVCHDFFCQLGNIVS